MCSRTPFSGARFENRIMRFRIVLAISVLAHGKSLFQERLQHTRPPREEGSDISSADNVDHEAA